jgi:hypothetical protein
MSYGSSYGNASGEEPEYGKKAYDEEAAAEEDNADPRASNFPWWCLPKCRCFFHNIGKEIKDKKMRPTVYREYITWYVALIAYFTNLVACAMRYHKRAVFGNASGVDLGISIALLILVYPTTLFIYFLLYGAARDVGKSWTWWWLLMGLQFCVELFFAIGIPRTGAAGLVTMIKAFEAKQKAVGFACMAVFLMFLTLFACHLANYIILWRYRSALEGGYTSQKNEKSNDEDASLKSSGSKSKKKQKKPSSKKPSKTSTPSPSDEDTYRPPEPTSSSDSSSGAYASSHAANDPNPSWHKPTGSAYESTGRATPTPKPSSTASGANPFGDDGSLDDFYS